MAAGAWSASGEGPRRSLEAVAVAIRFAAVSQHSPTHASTIFSASRVPSVVVAANNAFLAAFAPSMFAARSWAKCHAVLHAIARRHGAITGDVTGAATILQIHDGQSHSPCGTASSAGTRHVV